MRLQTRCRNCKQFFQLPISAVDRFKLANKIGEHPKLNCSYCHEQRSYDVNDIRATPSKFIGMLALLVLVFGTGITLLFFWDYLFDVGPYGAITLAALIGMPSIVYIILNRSQEQKISYFNRKLYG